MVRFAVSFLVASLAMLLAEPYPALACPAPGTGTVGAAAPTTERSERALRDFEMIAEGRIEAIDDLAGREALCQQSRAAMPPECLSDFSLAVCAGSARKIDLFCQPLKAAEIAIGKVWKGPALTRVALRHQPVLDIPCGGGVDLKVGDSITFCARYDETGALTGYPCPPMKAEILERFRSELSALQAAADAAPDDVDRLASLAAFQEEWLDVTGALTSYAKLATLQPEKATGPAGIGRVLYARGDIADALPHLRRALKLDPNDALAAELVRSGEMALAPP
jgi:tetratricopeptide (TPR) repeat protein